MNNAQLVLYVIPLVGILYYLVKLEKDFRILSDSHSRLENTVTASRIIMKRGLEN